MNAKGGALVIGSLYWDDDIDKKIKDGKRKEWRDTCLNVDNNIKIKVPIRYGRYSSKWQSYTMTFSTSLDRVDFGSSYVLPHKTSTSCETDLLNHATVMGKVEGIPSGLFCDWGAVGLLINPSSSLAGSITTWWANFYKKIPSEHDLFLPFDSDKRPTIDSNGLLTIDWPRDINGEILDGFDCLLATPTVPRHKDGKKRYPSSPEIVIEIQSSNRCDYFLSNIQHEITTFQDDVIRGLIK